MSKFHKALARGKAFEQDMDAFLRAKYPASTLRPVTVDTEKWSGVDRIITKPDGTTHAIEYKLDGKSTKTGNYFIETAVVYGDTRTPGWAVKTCADIIFIGVPGVYNGAKVWYTKALTAQHLREAVPTWLENYPTRTTAAHLNDGWHAEGVAVPVGVVHRTCAGAHLTWVVPRTTQEKPQ